MLASSCQECRQQQPRRYGELGMVIYLFSPENKQISIDNHFSWLQGVRAAMLRGPEELPDWAGHAGASPKAADGDGG